ncbi:MAG: signal peptidase I [Candidatus Woesearchaeota archaeon]|nr:signal peptidase I [Candidatus Woesearchaeota archaeon]
MGAIKTMLILVLALFTGIVIGSVIANVDLAHLKKSEMPSAILNSFSTKSYEISSPSDHIKEDKIHVYSDRIVIDVSNASWASFVNTNSMDPVIDSGANSIEIAPKSEEEIKVGDIISFTTDYTSGLVIHRVVSIGYDEQGIYYVTKGDNNPTADPGVRRFNDVKGIVIGIIY